MEQDIDKSKAILAEPASIVITTHRSPDGDAIGSSLGMYHYLRKKGHQVHVITPNDYPDFLHWLPGDETVIQYEESPEESDRLIGAADIIFCLDFNVLDRLEGMKPSIEQASATRFLLDHHPYPADLFDIVFSDPTSSSTAQIVHEFIEALGDSDMVDRTIADCLYVGVMTDTGSFRFSSTSPKTHRVAAELLEKGVDGADIQDKVFDNNSLQRMRLLGHVLSEKLQVKEAYKTAYISLSREESQRFQAKKGDTEGFVNLALSVKGVRFAAFFSEMEKGVKISFRSKGEFPANKVAGEHFNGGGHLNAAGGISYESLGSTIEHFIDVLPTYQDYMDQ